MSASSQSTKPTQKNAKPGRADRSTYLVPAVDPTELPGDKIERLPHGDRWFLDGFATLQLPGGLLGRQIDMSVAQRAVEVLRSRGIRATYTHVVVRAIALALRRYPEGLQMVAGYRRLQPSSVDIGLSVAGQTSYAPVLVIKDADERPLPGLVNYMHEAVATTRTKEVTDLAGMRRNGWIIPFGSARRFILRLLNRAFWFRRKLVGTFQLTCLPGTDWVVPMMFYSGIAAGFGQVQDRVIAQNGQAVVRPAAWLTLAFDHKAHDGMRVMNLLRHIEETLQSEQLLIEAGELPTRVLHDGDGDSDSDGDGDSTDPSVPAPADDPTRQLPLVA